MTVEIKPLDEGKLRMLYLQGTKLADEEDVEKRFDTFEKLANVYVPHMIVRPKVVQGEGTDDAIGTSEIPFIDRIALILEAMGVADEEVEEAAIAKGFLGDEGGT